MTDISDNNISPLMLTPLMPVIAVLIAARVAQAHHFWAHHITMTANGGNYDGITPRSPTMAITKAIQPYKSPPARPAYYYRRLNF